jgi:hypothetical protein
MTLVLAANGSRSIWLLTDRRLSAPGKRSSDGARKVLLLETTDAVALLGYAGLGSTPRGTEPSDWMARVLRGRNGLTLDASLGLLAGVAQRELPPHLASLGGMGTPPHYVVAVAFLRQEPSLYSIFLTCPPGSTEYRVGWTRYVSDKQTGRASTSQPHQRTRSRACITNDSRSPPRRTQSSGPPGVATGRQLCRT